MCAISFRLRQATKDMLSRAKHIVQNKYLVVGLTEDIPAFMEILEVFMPHFFRNATQIFREMGKQLVFLRKDNYMKENG